MKVIDLILTSFFNNENLKREIIVKEFKTILENARLDHSLPNLKIEHSNGHVITATYKDFKFDILAAPNIATSNDEVMESQRAGVYDTMKLSDNPKLVGNVSSALAETAVDFVKNQK